jgi:hypothetical protein
MPPSKWRARDQYGKIREGVCGARRAVRMTAGLHPCRLTSWSFSREDPLVLATGRHVRWYNERSQEQGTAVPPNGF